MNKTFRRITNILIVILAILIVLLTTMGIFEMLDGMRSYTASEDSMVYALEDGRYGDLVDDYHRNMAADAKSNETMKACYGVAKYYEAALDYQIALAAENEQAAGQCEARMKEAYEEMGELSFAKEEIDRLLERE